MVSGTREVRHVVHGRPFGKFGEVECSWLRVALKGMNKLEMDEGEGGWISCECERMAIG